jgi:Luciferase
MMRAMSSRLTDALCRIPGVVEAESAFKDGPAFWVNGTEIAHFESEHAIDLRLTRAQIRDRRARLRADGRVRLRASSADWLTVEFSSLQDEEFVCELAEVAAAAHRPAPGTTPLPPPAGPALQRRKRFH